MTRLGSLLVLLCWAALALCLVVSPATAARGAKPNLLANPGFEEPLKGHPWMPAAWDTFASGLSTVFYARDTLLVHGGRYAVSVANLSTYVPMWHNWSQTLVVGKEQWDKDLVFSIWTRSNGMQGRAYILLQAYRDTVGKMAHVWKVDREEAYGQLGINKIDDPSVNLGWNREYFSEHETDWVRREVRIYVPPTTNVVVVRGGLFGTGQVIFDDASLVAEAPMPAPALPLNVNLLKDPGFEGNGDEWEYSMPPFEGLRIERDTTVFHGGKASIRMEGGDEAPFPARTGVCQVVSNRNFAAKRVRLSAWIRTDSLQGNAYIKIYCTTPDGDYHAPAVQYGMNTDWTETVMEVDTPPNTVMVWAWALYNAPAAGRLYYDDVSLEVLGPAEYIRTGAPPPKPHPLPVR